MEEDPEDLSSLHFQILFPPHEASHRQREYELEQHLALMDEPAQAPVRRIMDGSMQDIGNLTMEQLTGFEDDSGERRDDFGPMEEEGYPDEDVLDIGIEASDLGSLLQQFEQTEAAMTGPESVENRERSKIKSKSRKQPVLDPKNLAKRITPVKRKTTILLEPLAMPSKRLRARDLLTAERACVSLPGSRASSPVAVPPRGLSVVCSADQGFDYLVMDHDYCTVSVGDGQVLAKVASASSIPPDDLAARPTAEQRKAVYKQKYKIRKRGKKTGESSGQQHTEMPKEQVPLMNKLPDYIHPMPQVVVPVKSGSTRDESEEESRAAEAVEPPAEEDGLDKPVFFDKIPNYFLGKHMYQEISKVEEARRKEEEEEMTRLKEKEAADSTEGRETKQGRHHGRRSRHRRRDKRRSVCTTDVHTTTGGESPSGDTLQASTSGDRNGAELKEGAAAKPKGSQDAGKIDEDENPAIPPFVLEGISNGRPRPVYRRGGRHICCSRYRSRSFSSRSSRSSSGSSVGHRYFSSSSSESSHCSRSRRRRHESRDSYSSWSPSSSRSRSRSRSRSYRRRSRRYSTYSSASRTSSSSRSRSRSHSRSRQWRPRSRSRSWSRSRSRRSRSRSCYSRRSRSRDKDRRYRRRSRGRDRDSRSRSRRRSLERQEEEEERRQKRSKEQQEQWTDRRVVYIGRIPYGTTREAIRKRFEKFGEIERITLHFRDVGDNYAFVTFLYKCDAYAAVEGANKETSEPEYDICFGGRRQFCKSNYEDLDSMGKEEVALEFGYSPRRDLQDETTTETDFDRLLREAMKKSKR